MQIRSVMIVNVVLMLGLLAMDTGCSRWPWQRKSEVTDTTGAGLDGPTLVGNPDSDFSSLYDETGMPLTGERFEEMFQAVQGVNYGPIYFGFDSYALPPAELAKVDQVARHLQSNPSHVLVIEGHCDERGSNEYNLSLGENRALAVRSYLVNLGIAPDRIQTRSYGEEKPAVAGYGEEVWRLNRRGEFALFQK